MVLVAILSHAFLTDITLLSARHQYRHDVSKQASELHDQVPFKHVNYNTVFHTCKYTFNS